MMFSSNCFLCLFLVVLATQVTLAIIAVPATEAPPPATQAPPPLIPPSSASCPQAGLLLEKLVNLSAALSNINNSLISVFDLIDEQCPCLDASPECFETRVSNFRTALEELIVDADNVTLSAPTDCPGRTGAVFVATCNGTDVAVVDPNGVIQNGFNTDTSVTGWAVYINGGTYGFDYFRNGPFEVRCRSTPNGIEVVLGNSGDSPLTSTAVGTGIIYDPDTGKDYVAISFSNAILNGIYCFDRTTFPLITLLFGFDGDTGRIEVHDGFVYMIDGKKIVRRRLDFTDDWAQVLFFSENIKDFDVADNGHVVFSDESGAVYVYDPVKKTYKQLRTPTSDGRCGFTIGINPCDSLLYVANINDAELQIFNTTTCQLVGSLTYTDSTPSPCPSVAFDPTFCCA